jgi:chromosomal replication initiation ATPase DnaA
MKPRQLALDLPVRVARDREDFLVTPSNASAVALLDQWPNWPSHAALIVGPAGSGKSHLCHVFATIAGAEIISVGSLTVEAVAGHMEKPVVAVEMNNASFNESAMFHLLNRARQTGGHVLLTAQQPATQWGVKLPDLASRLGALPVIIIAAPDDELMHGVLLKHFADRQLVPQPSAMTYILQRIPRDLDAVARLAAELDRRALEERKALSRPFVAKVLTEVFPEVSDES